MKNLPPLERVRSLLHYNPITGELTYLQQRGPRRPGDPAGSTQGGIPHVYIDGAQRKAAAVAWLLASGADPSPQHVHCADGNPLNLALANLKLSPDPPVYRSPRARTKKPPAVERREIRFDRIQQAWKARYGRIKLGYFGTRKEAGAARNLAIKEASDA